MSENHFALLNLEICYDIDLKTLENHYINLQSIYHPDFFISETEKKLASIEIVKINEAYHTLLSPLKRAQYLLKIYKIPKIKPCDANKIAIKVVEIQEESEDNASSIDQAIKICIDDISLSFAKKDYSQASQLTLFLKYLTRLTNKQY